MLNLIEKEEIAKRLNSITEILIEEHMENIFKTI